jgi:3-deoxy-7-phosphoheptulonate synthase
VDPSHGTGKARFVAPMAKASMAAGAHGLMIEVHHDPSEALSDGSQALLPDQYATLVQELTRLGEFLGVQVV